MKLIIQIPCFNEELTLPETLKDLPKKIDGIDTIETLIIDDGSTDNTLEVAKKLGVNHIIALGHNKGLANAFQNGIEESLKRGADIIVNTDGDNQYFGGDIVKLVEPILEGKADIVIGDRQTDTIKHFTTFKKKLQRAGTKFICYITGVRVNDAVSGFRGYSRKAAIHINVFSGFSYTLENIIQFSQNKFNIVSVPVRTNKKLRESRLFKGMTSFLTKQLTTLVRIYTTYKALKAFTFIGIMLLIPGLIGFIRFLYFFFSGDGDGHIQSLLFSTVFIILGFLIIIFGIMADHISNNRKLIEKVLVILKEESWNKMK